MGMEERASRYRVRPRDENSQRVIEALQKLYRKKLRPLEKEFMFESFHYDAITDAELEAKSQVLVIGQYSTGKTTFIRNLLGVDFPNMNIGPEPTTDKFTVVMHGKDDRAVEGNSLAVIKELPYQGLSRFGTGLLNKLDAAISTSPFLENITLVDTPGVLSGEMQRHQRAYDFADVARWFADRSDMILILFDAHRLDVSSELMEILTRLAGHQHVIRIVLNKADQVDEAQLRRVYGALMWSMSKVFDNPEVVRVYVGSFWDKPLKYTTHRRLFEADQQALIQEVMDLPRLSAVRKINQVIRRTKLLKAHAYILSYLREQMPWMYGGDRQRRALLENIEGVLETVRAKHGLHEGDMPEPQNLRTKLECLDFKEFPRLSLATLRKLEDIVDVDIQMVLQQGGGSAQIFKFSTGRESQRRGLFRGASSMYDLLGTNKLKTFRAKELAVSNDVAELSAERSAFSSEQIKLGEVGVRGGDAVLSGSRKGAHGKGGWGARLMCCVLVKVLIAGIAGLMVIIFVVESSLPWQLGGGFSNEADYLIYDSDLRGMRRRGRSNLISEAVRGMGFEVGRWTGAAQDDGAAIDVEGRRREHEGLKALYSGTIH